jgi:hypothetical protein
VSITIDMALVRMLTVLLVTALAVLPATRAGCDSCKDEENAFKAAYDASGTTEPAGCPEEFQDLVDCS